MGAASQPIDARVATMARVAGTLFLLGSALSVAGILLPHSPKAEVLGFWSIALATAVIAVPLLRYGHRLPEGAYQWVMLLGSLIVTLSLYFNGERLGGASAGNQVLYIWIALYSGYYFSRRWMIAQLCAIAGLYAGVLVLIAPGPVALTRWLITAGMVSTAAVLVHVLSTRNGELLERLSTAARTDSLTSLVNRQGFDERLELELAKGRRTGRPTALIVADIDHFKAINDRFGHAAGDAALQVVAETAGGAARLTDTVARMGGDEFAVILPDTDAEGAFAFAERVREEILAAQEASELPITMSLGIAESDVDGLTPAILTGSADKALYLAKSLGRNQVVAAAGARESVRSHGRAMMALAANGMPMSSGVGAPASRREARRHDAARV
jgi:diguanylate cyclase (GGDEF)-like protein